MTLRRAVRLVGGLLLAALVVAGTAAPAAAQQVTPDPDPATTRIDGSDQRLFNQAAARAELESDIERCERLASQQPPDANRSDIAALEEWARCSQLLEEFGFVGAEHEAQWFGGEARTQEGFAISAYRLHFDAGAWNHVDRRIFGALMTLGWFAGVTSLRMATWAFDWAANSRLTDVIAGLPEQFREEIASTGIVSGAIVPLALLVVPVSAGLAIMFSRKGQAMSQLMWFGAALLVGSIILADPQGYHNVVLDFRSSLGGLAQLQGANPADPTDDVDAAATVEPLMSAAVHAPWEELNWGGKMPSAECEARAAEVLTRRPDSTSDWPREHMADCPAGADKHAHNPSMTRLMATWVVAAGQILLGLLVMSVALLALASELSLAIAFAVLPVVAAIALFPSGRGVVAWWAGTAAYGCIGLVVSLFALNALQMVLTGVLSALSAADVPMLTRFGVWLLLVGLLWSKRRDIKGMSKKISAKLGGKVATAGGGGSGAGAAVGAGAIGALGGAAAMASMSGGGLGSPGMGVAGAAGLTSLARSARDASSRTMGKVGQVAAARNPDGLTARTIGATAAGGGAGLGMSAALAAAQSLGGARRQTQHAAEAANMNPDRAARFTLEGNRRQQQLAAASDLTQERDFIRLAAGGDSKVIGQMGTNSRVPEAIREDIADGVSHRRIAQRARSGDYGEYVPTTPRPAPVPQPDPASPTAGTPSAGTGGAGSGPVPTGDSGTQPTSHSSDTGPAHSGATHSGSTPAGATSATPPPDAQRTPAPDQPAATTEQTSTTHRTGSPDGAGGQPTSGPAEPPDAQRSPKPDQPAATSEPPTGDGGQPHGAERDSTSGTGGDGPSGTPPPDAQRPPVSELSAGGENPPDTTTSTGNEGTGSQQRPPEATPGPSPHPDQPPPEAPDRTRTEQNGGSQRNAPQEQPPSGRSGTAQQPNDPRSDTPDPGSSPPPPSPQRPPSG